MRCEHTKTSFRAGRSYPIPVSVPCRRTARVAAGVPFGESVMHFNYCREDAETRAVAVLHSRGKVVSITDLPPPPPVPRDAQGRFISVGAGHATR